MKHFLGGSALGLLLGLLLLPRNKGDSDTEYLICIFAHLLFALLVGTALWGLLP